MQPMPCDTASAGLHQQEGEARTGIRQLDDPARAGRLPRLRGAEWKPDNRYTSYWYHDDPNPPTTDFDRDNATFRVVPNGSVRGWQCRYVRGALDDTSHAMGTYDYADSSVGAAIKGRLWIANDMHDEMDVNPHEGNGAYVPGLTRVYCQ